MRVAITGGTGLVGRALAAVLTDAGHEVVILSRRPDGVRGFPAGVSAEGWDTVSADRLIPVLEAVDGVVHLAGENIGSGRWTERKKRRIRDSRVRSTEALAAAFAGCGNRPGVLVQGSAVGFYGPRGDESVPETTAPGTDFLALVCRDWEAAGESAEPLGVRRVVARTGVVLAVEGGALPRIVLPFKLWVGGAVGSGRQVLPWIHLQDEVEAIVHLLEDDGAEGAFNLAAPGAVSNRQLAHAIGKVLRRPSFVPTPGIALRLILGEMATLVLDGQRAVPERLLERGYEFRFPEVEGALRDLLL
ncbi:MAG: TIGR01777 family protein [bacterium]|nr:TIGR01777 family protein [bacterium]